MLELIISAIGLGFMLSLFLSGQYFFLLIETSFSRGHKHALALDIGVISADIFVL
jgi:threonine/homoserine/homoserine lactone efflux protein